MELPEGKLELREYAGSIGHNYSVKLNGTMIGAIVDNMDLTVGNIMFDNAFLIVCLLMGIGLGILVGFFCNLIVAANSHSLDFRNEYEAISSAYGASVLLFGGLGLIVAFVIETNMKKKEDK